jgi:hypothetical protein
MHINTGGSDRGQSTPDHGAIQGYLKLLHDRARLSIRGPEARAHCLVLLGVHHRDDAGAGVRTKRFKIGDADDMASTAAAWSVDGFNVYMAPAVYCRSKLTARGRGTVEAVSVWLGIGGDVDHDYGQDAGEISKLKPLPTLTLMTSREPRPNYNTLYVFDRPVAFDQCKRLADGLCRVLGDRNGSTADLNHVWRIPGSLNWITRKKANRRNLPWPCPPQTVSIDPDLSSRALVEPGDLQTFLEIEEEAKPTFTAQPHPLDPTRNLVIGRDLWNGDERELARLLAMIRHLDQEEHRRRTAGETMPTVHGRTYDMSDRGAWLWVGAALHVYFTATEQGFGIWRMASGGDPSSGITGAPGAWDEDDARRVWASFSDPTSHAAKKVGRLLTIGTLIQYAGFCGFDTRRGRHGLGTLPRRATEPCPQAKRVAEAGVAFHQLKEIGGYDVRWEAQEALKLHAAGAMYRFGRANLVLAAIAGHLHMSKGRGGAPGCAWKTSGAFCQDISERTGVTWARQDWWREVRRLERAGVLVSSPGNRIGAHGLKGGSYALTPPPGHTWPSLIEEYRKERGHRAGTSSVADTTPLKTHNPRGQSVPTLNQVHPASRSYPEPTHTIPTTTTEVAVDTGQSNRSSSAATNLEGTTGTAGMSLTAWMTSGAIPTGFKQAMHEVSLRAGQTKADHIVEKLNRVRAAGITNGSIACLLSEVEATVASRQRWRERQQLRPLDATGVLTLAFEELTIRAAAYDVDVREAAAIIGRRERQRKRFRHRNAAFSGGRA